MAEGKEQKVFFKKFGKWAPIIGGIWVGSHIAVPLLLLRIPAAQKILIALENKLPFDIPGLGQMNTELICFFLLGIAALLLNAGLSSQALPIFWLVLPLSIKVLIDTNKTSTLKEPKPVNTDN